MLSNRHGQIAYGRFLEVTNVNVEDQAALDATEEERKAKYLRAQAIQTLKQNMSQAFAASDGEALALIIDQATEMGAHAQARIAKKLLGQLEEDY